ncbi:PROM1 protein, partial [Psilopogon haemacephalus]|nr:PROM1 protein [Psilopogon haemacephalus]
MELGNISQPVYGPGLVAPETSTPLLVAMLHGFLQLVQPNDLPIESSGTPVLCYLSFFLSQLLIYELGFLVCAAIGLLFILLVPLVGCCFCCCRL